MQSQAGLMSGLESRIQDEFSRCGFLAAICARNMAAGFAAKPHGTSPQQGAGDRHALGAGVSVSRAISLGYAARCPTISSRTWWGCSS